MTRATEREPSGPLVGVRVLDFCSFIAGSFGAMLLGDMGAEVIKIEPLTGDLCRQWGPFIRGESRFFQGWNRNKKSVSVDLRSGQGREVVYRLTRGTDVVMENFRPGVTERLAIDYPTLQEINPQIIYASSSAFGSKGPYSRRPGYDPVLQAMGGSAHLQQRYGGRIAICSVAVSDYQAAMLMVGAVNAALFHRERTGQGQRLETSLLQAIMSVQSHFYAQPLDVEEEGPLGIFPYRLFETSSGQIFIAGGTDKFWQLLCEALGVPELGKATQYLTNPQRVANAEELAQRLDPIFLERTALEWESILVEAGVPCGAVRTPEEFFNDPQVEAMGMNPVVRHVSFGDLRVAGVPVHFEGTPARIQRAAPLLGQHTREVLAEIGYRRDQIEQLLESGVVACAEE